MATSKSGRNLEQEHEPLTAEQLGWFKTMLNEKRESILNDRSESGGPKNAQEKLPDEVDLATAEYEAAFEYRLRDREQYLLKKIDTALRRIEEGEYDECEDCGSIIGEKRLKARPEATLCIVCKEEQEQREKGFLKKRQIREDRYGVE